MKCVRCKVKEAEDDTFKVCYDCNEKLHPGVHKQMEEINRTLDIIARVARGMSKNFGEVNYHWECDKCGKKIKGSQGSVFNCPTCCGQQMKCVKGKLNE